MSRRQPRAGLTGHAPKTRGLHQSLPSSQATRTVGLSLVELRTVGRPEPSVAPKRRPAPTRDETSRRRSLKPRRVSETAAAATGLAALLATRATGPNIDPLRGIFGARVRGHLSGIRILHASASAHFCFAPAYLNSYSGLGVRASEPLRHGRRARPPGEERPAGRGVASVKGARQGPPTRRGTRTRDKRGTRTRGRGGGGLPSERGDGPSEGLRAVIEEVHKGHHHQARLVVDCHLRAIPPTAPNKPWRLNGGVMGANRAPAQDILR